MSEGKYAFLRFATPIAGHFLIFESETGTTVIKNIIC